ncbi:hypothetical protein MLD38_015157 [Melastoma candidum]|uniref:Uncharacterized protein n=1 Tax=Melastoma candidum TaxID=119954 RepID=A0ACB9REG3_9MYRT|nr:hypothetical protein MLD38_015157 [Melastoma candidum]
MSAEFPSLSSPHPDSEYTQPYDPEDPAVETTGGTAQLLLPSQEDTYQPAAVDAAPSDSKKWPGWPGDCVFRLVVPVAKVGSIIGRKGELIKRMCEETRARIRVLDGPSSVPDRVVLITGKEEPESPLSPAMDAAIRVFKRVSGISETEELSGESAAVFCSIKLLVASTQAISLIGKQGSTIKSMQESSGASIRVLPEGELPVFSSSDERIVEMQGEFLKVLKAVEAVVGHLRKFLVDHSVLPLFEKPVTSNTIVPKDRQLMESWNDKSLLQSIQSSASSDYSLSSKRESLFVDRDIHLESQLASAGALRYRQDPALLAIHPGRVGRVDTPIVTQVVQTMQIPLTYAEDIIGIAGTNIAYIRRTSGAVLTVQESRLVPDKITVEIKGTSSQVQTAQRLIQEFINGHKEPVSTTYGKFDGGARLYSQLGDASYPSTGFSSQPYSGGYGSSLGGYNSFRL